MLKHILLLALTATALFHNVSSASQAFDLTLGKQAQLITLEPVTNIVKGNSSWTIQNSPEDDGLFIWANINSSETNITAYTDNYKYTFSIKPSEDDHVSFLSVPPELRNKPLNSSEVTPTRSALERMLAQSDKQDQEQIDKERYKAEAALIKEAEKEVQKKELETSETSINELEKKSIDPIEIEAVARIEEEAPIAMTIEELEKSVAPKIKLENWAYEAGIDTNPVSSKKDVYTVQASDYLYRLNAILNIDDYSPAKYMGALYEINPKAFESMNPELLLVGSMLTLPTKSDVVKANPINAYLKKDTPARKNTQINKEDALVASLTKTRDNLIIRTRAAKKETIRLRGRVASLELQVNELMKMFEAKNS